MVLVYFHEVKARTHIGRMLFTLILVFTTLPSLCQLVGGTEWSRYIQKIPRRTPTVPEGGGVIARALAGEYYTDR